MATVTNELRLTEIEGRGRSLVAAQPLKAGQIVLRNSPILLYPALPSPSPYCAHCFKALNLQNPKPPVCHLCYFPVNQGFSSRQRTLSEDYGFVCQCDRCNVEADWSDNEEDVVADEEGGGAGSMDEDQDEEMEEGSESEQGGDEFPHAYFFVRFMCSKSNCWGTLAPLPPEDDGTASDVMECNVCGSLKKDEEIDGGH